MAWLPIDQGLVNHRKVWALERLLGIPVPTIVGHLVLMWLWAVDSAPAGCISEGEAWTIEKAASWTGEPGTFVAALEEAGLLDHEDGCLRIHDWADYGGRILEARRRNAEYQRRHRERKADVSLTSALHKAPEKKRKDKRRKTDQTDAQGGESFSNEEELVSAGDLVAIYHELCPSLPRVRELTDTRTRRLRWAAKKLGLEGLRCFFAQVEASDFLTGRSREWRADLDWILKPEHLTRILEGAYDNRRPAGPQEQASPAWVPFEAPPDLTPEEREASITAMREAREQVARLSAGIGKDMP